MLSSEEVLNRLSFLNQFLEFNPYVLFVCCFFLFFLFVCFFGKRSFADYVFLIN
jgi:hypothetical protein